MIRVVDLLFETVSGERSFIHHGTLQCGLLVESAMHIGATLFLRLLGWLAAFSCLLCGDCALWSEPSSPHIKLLKVRSLQILSHLLTISVCSVPAISCSLSTSNASKKEVSGGTCRQDETGKDPPVELKEDCAR